MRISRLTRFLGLVFLTNSLFSASIVGQQNFVRTWRSQAPGNNQNDIGSKNLRQVREETTYFDGLGRTSQSVQRRGSLVTNPSDIQNSSSAVDLVKTTAYYTRFLLLTIMEVIHILMMGNTRQIQLISSILFMPTRQGHWPIKEKQIFMV